MDKIKQGITESKMFDELLNYKLEPSEKIRRKIDYFITPYNSQFCCTRGMTFSEDENE